MIQKVKNFFSEVQTEMQKVTWPTREELIGSTGVVLMLMFILSSFIGVTDLLLSAAMTGLLR